MNENNNRELRFLVTQKCNYSCVFCHGEGLQTQKNDHLSKEDYAFMFGAAQEIFGWNTTTLTGGEPLIRNDIIEIAESLYNQGSKTTVTTNGALLGTKNKIGKYVDRINLSIHSTHKETYEALVQRNGAFEHLMEGIHDFRCAFPDTQLRLNATMIKNVNANESDVVGLLNLAQKLQASVKYVVLFPPTQEGYISSEQIAATLKNLGFTQNDAKLRKDVFSDGKTEVSVAKIFCAAALEDTSPSTFCRKNNDFFVSPDGKIKPCRFEPEEIDLIHAIKRRDKVEFADSIKAILSRENHGCLSHLRKIVAGQGFSNGLR